MARQEWAGTGRTVAVVIVGLALLALSVAWRFPFAGALLFSRIRRDKILEHDTRRRTLEVVAARPGMALQELQASLGVAWGTMVHHVGLLERHGRIVSVRQGPRRLLFAASTPEARARGDLALLRTATAHGIARTVHEHPGIQQVEVARVLGLRAPSASKHLARMANAGLVVVERVSGACRYNATPRLAQALALSQAPGHLGMGETRPPRPWRAVQAAERAVSEPAAG